MYIHIGNNYVAKREDIIGIFDLDSTTVSKKTRLYLTKAEKRGEVISVNYDLPKSFIVCSSKNKENKVYLSHLSSNTLLKRIENNNF
ncbi:MAG: DUF370 domain-containing protein [Clostridia bacterium]|nr:DUF370 domain-containing protein [Clostridia bacterium]